MEVCLELGVCELARPAFHRKTAGDGGLDDLLDDPIWVDRPARAIDPRARRVQRLPATGVVRSKQVELELEGHLGLEAAGAPGGTGVLEDGPWVDREARSVTVEVRHPDGGLILPATPDTGRVETGLEITQSHVIGQTRHRQDVALE